MTIKILFTEEEKQKIINLYKNDIAIKNITNIYNCSVTTIINLLKNEKIFKPAKYKNLAYKYIKYTKSKKLCEKLYNNSSSLKDFSNKLECSIDMARNILLDHNITILVSHEIKRKNSIPLNEKDIIFNYINNDFSISKLKNKYKTSSNTIKSILTKNNIKIVNNSIKQLSKNAKLALNDFNYAKTQYENSITLFGFQQKLNCGALTAKKIIEFHGLKNFTITDSKYNKYVATFHNNFKNFKLIDKSGPYLTINHNICDKKFSITTQTAGKWKQYDDNDLCPYCNNRYKTSKFEKDIKNFLLDNNISFVSNDKSILGHNLELNILSKEYNIAIECCELYWHSNIFKHRTYHLDKLKLCKDKNIKLITIFEDEWKYKKHIVENRLLYAFGIIDKKIYARNCSIITNINKNDALLFLEKNHIQGKDNAKIYLGLSYNNEIIGICSFKKPNVSTNNVTDNKNIYELSRYCTSIHTIGGFSKLLSHFIKLYNPEKIITFSDRRWGEGEVYSKNKFTFIHSTNPNYWYVKGLNRIHRYNFAKHKLINKFPEYKSLTESQIVENELNYNKIYDCGSNKYEFIK
jgi:hypothetical protein